jgi:DNA/RNA endonuclease G (NUC1)
MRRTLRPSALALGLFATLSCAPDGLFVPQPPRATLSEFAGRASAMPEVRISEIHYDNTGADVLEAVEISGPEGMDLANWRVVPYNGANGQTYAPIVTLSGTIPATCSPRGVVVVPIAGLQNGAPDGVALVNAAGNVIEFLSYEGAFTATNGPAGPPAVGQPGRTSTDIGVSETGGASEPASPPEAVKSLQRNSVDSWTGPIANTLGACNDVPPASTPVASLTLAPAEASILAGSSQVYTAIARDAEGNSIPGAPLGWSSSDHAIANVSATGVATAFEPGEVTITVTALSGANATATLTVTEPPPLPPTNIFITEIHYDNGGADEGEAIEVEGPAGTDFTGWTLVAYNGNGGATYATFALPASGTSCTTGRVVAWVAAPGLQNGAPDGIALVNGSGAVVEFISYEGTFRATNGVAAGRRAFDIGVDETGSGPANSSLQKDALGWYGPATSSFGACNVAPSPFVSIVGRTFSDAPLPVGFEDQLFATFNDGRGNTAPAEFSWSSDTPGLASVDADGVVRALGAGTAVIRATGPGGATGTISLPTHVATASPTAVYQGNTEFGVPTDDNASNDLIVKRAQYTSSFDTDRGIPNWVSFNLEATHFGTLDRCDCFTYDPELPSDKRYTTADYTGAGAAAGYGIDRGHLARSFDRTAGSLDNATTFYFSNIIPQASHNNQGPWAAMEIFIGDKARFENKEVYVIAGASGSKGTVKDEKKITIPSAVWKVVVVMPRDEGLSNVSGPGDIEVIAVIMPNDSGIAGVDWNTYRTTVNAVEALSGYDVLSLLDDRIEAVVETGLQDEVALVDQLVAGGKLSTGNGNSLTSKLEAAASSIERGNATAAINQLEAFVNEVDAMSRSRRLDDASAQALRAAATTLILSLAS